MFKTYELYGKYEKNKIIKEDIFGLLSIIFFILILATTTLSKIFGSICFILFVYSFYKCTFIQNIKGHKFSNHYFQHSSYDYKLCTSCCKCGITYKNFILDKKPKCYTKKDILIKSIIE